MASCKHSVWLRVYDLTGGKVAKLAPFVMRRPIKGIWHTAIYAYGNEYFYSDSISKLPPEMVEKELKMSPVMVTHLGDTCITQREFECFLASIRGRFTPKEYHLLKWNCNHFSNICSRFLLDGKEIPAEIQNLPQQVEDSVVGRMVLKWLSERNPVSLTDSGDNPHWDVFHVRSQSSCKTSASRGLSAAPRRTATARPVLDDDISLVVHSPPRRLRDHALTKESVRRTREHTRNHESSPRQVTRETAASPSPGRVGQGTHSRIIAQTQRSNSPPVSPVSTARERFASNMGVAHLVSIRDADTIPSDKELALSRDKLFTYWRRQRQVPRATSHAILNSGDKTPLLSPGQIPEESSMPPAEASSTRLRAVTSSNSLITRASSGGQGDATARPEAQAKWASVSLQVRSRPPPTSTPSLMEMLRPSPLAARMIQSNLAASEVLQGVSILSAFRKVA